MKTVRWCFTIVAVSTLAWGCPARAADEPCAPHGLDPKQVREQLKRWPGLQPFALWRILDLQLAPCARDEQVLTHLRIRPPEKWSLYALPYGVWLTLALDAQGQPLGPPPAAFKELAEGVRRMVARAERHEDVRRFIERFGVAVAEIDKTAEAGRFRVTFIAGAQPGQVGPRVPSLTYDESSPGRIVAYQLPRMDSLPARRELLRMLEVLSAHHPHCRPSWIEAGQKPSPGPEVEPIRWTFQVELAGSDCPTRYAAQLEPDGAVARLGGEGGARGEPAAKGDAGGGQ